VRSFQFSRSSLNASRCMSQRGVSLGRHSRASLSARQRVRIVWFASYFILSSTF
jgi:hypothetical protein